MRSGFYLYNKFSTYILDLHEKNEIFENTQCVICDSTDETKINTIGQFGLPANVVICRNCGLSYLNPDGQKLIDFYTHKYDSYYRPDMSKVKNASSTYVHVYKRLVKINLLGPHIKKVLDIGSGESQFSIPEKSIAYFFILCYRAFFRMPSIASKNGR